jgi:hypothetical protein
MKMHCVVVAAFFLGSSPASVRAEKAPVGSEFQINTFSSEYQDGSAVCSAANGDFVVTWRSRPGQDGDESGVFGQRFDSGGAKQGTEFQVNSYTAGAQSYAQVCCAADGEFVVIWQSVGQDGDQGGIFGQRFDSGGAKRGPEFQVNTFTTERQYFPSLCCDANADFVVSWSSRDQDGELTGVFGQRYDDQGDPRGTEFQINTFTGDRQETPRLCCDEDGDFTVAWESKGQDGSQPGVFAQRFDSGGMAQGFEFHVNTFTVDDQRDPAVCCGADGRSVITWESRADQDGDERGVFGQRYDAQGLPQGGEFQINTYTTDGQFSPAVCCDRAGDFVVSWTSFTQDGSERGVFGQRFDSLGVPQGTEFQVNEYTTAFQESPAIACSAGGDFVVTWESEDQDGSSDGVFGRRYAGPAAPFPVPLVSWLGLAAVVVALALWGAHRLRLGRS